MGGRQAPELRRPALSCSTLSEALTKGPFVDAGPVKGDVIGKGVEKSPM